MTRVRAALTHFSISAAVLACFLFLVLFVWYAWPFNFTQGIGEIIYLLIAVDVVLGPLLTFTVFRVGKKNLKFDLIVIVAIQIAALIYGAMVIYKERPMYIVFNIDRFSVVSYSDIDMEQNTSNGAVIGLFDSPKLIFAKLPNNIETLRMDIVNGVEGVEHLPKYYRDYSSNRLSVIRGTKPASSLDVDAGPIDMIEHINYAPVVGKKNSIIALIDNRTGNLIEYRLVDPWEK